MTEPLLEQQSNTRSALHCKKEICLVIISATVGAIASLLICNNSLDLKSVVFQKTNILKDQISRPNAPKDHIAAKEIAISYLGFNGRQTFSKAICSGDENDISAWKDRLCVFSSICYNKITNRFDYFRLNQSKPKPVFYDKSYRMLFRFGVTNADIPFLTLTVGGDTAWTPLVVNESYPTENFTRLHQLHSLTKTRFASSNIGHGLWEDLGSISYSLDRMNIIDRNLVIMHMNRMDNTSLFRMYHKYIIRALTDHPMVQFETYMSSFNTKYVCFDRLIVGGELSVFPRTQVKEYHGREIIYYNWRSKIIQNNGFNPNFVPKKHHIIITNKTESIYKRVGMKRHRAIANLEEVANFLQDTYPNISSEVIEWQYISFDKQIEMLLNTTILITPGGGVSLTLPLLPHGAHAIIMDYFVTEPGHGYFYGQSGSMEGAFFNHIPHVRKQYYQIYGPQEYEFDYSGATDAREMASIIINTKRLQLLIDKALEEMEF
ncbi:unnamed protein product [Adineta ricciae]|uniref:Glycosyltransferase 61 catalytic domain-containing protein n=1 Tax=Adineta ricciae TaxID=249248 RepID=A0A816DAT7_ADIRI|nr:unnamed protein product [Adineta ricciae]CAF1635695.1 unnamed protein product [Adineta ricciae]